MTSVPIILAPYRRVPNGVTSVADPDPGSGAFFTPGSGIRVPGWVKGSIRIRDPIEQPGSYFLELRNHFFG